MSSQYSSLQFHHCKPLADIWGNREAYISRQQQLAAAFAAANPTLPPLIIPSANDCNSPPSSPSSPRSLSSVSTSSDSPLAYNSTATLFPPNTAATNASPSVKRDSSIWGGNTSFSIVDPEPQGFNSFVLSPLNDMFERVSISKVPVSQQTLPVDQTSRLSFDSSSSASPFPYEQHQQYFIQSKQEYYDSIARNPTPPLNFYHESVESPIDSMPTTPVSSISCSSLSTSPSSVIGAPITPAESPITAPSTISKSRRGNNNNNAATNACNKTTRKMDSRNTKKVKPMLNTDLYKTELCSSFVRSGGYCPYGDKCQFAHGDDELKRVDRPNNWRSKPCQNWIKTGTCAYNERCCFRHGM